MFSLHFEAPWASAKLFRTSFYRPSAPFLHHSSAYGLLLNIAGIDYRDEQGCPKEDIPQLKLAIGFCSSLPVVQKTYHQLHNYPVGSGSADDEEGMTAEEIKEHRAGKYYGRKRNIKPAKVESLWGLHGCIACQADSEFEDLLRAGLRGELSRFGLPFAGENQHIFDVLEEGSPDQVQWFVSLDVNKQTYQKHLHRSTIWVDRKHSEDTVNRLFIPSDEPAKIPPQNAWVEIPPE